MEGGEGAQPTGGRVENWLTLSQGLHLTFRFLCKLGMWKRQIRQTSEMVKKMHTFPVESGEKVKIQQCQNTLLQVNTLQ